MAIPRLCRFYRDLCKLYVDSGSPDIGQGVGYCDLDCDQTTCNGGSRFLSKIRYFEEILF